MAARKKKYFKKPGFHVKAEFIPIIGRTSEILIKRDGVVTQESFLAEASKSSSPAHKCFEWDDAKAAHAHRLERAGYFIQAVEVVYHGSRVPAFVEAKPVFASGKTSFGRAVQDASITTHLLMAAIAALQQWTLRFSRIKEAGAANEHVRKAIEELEKVVKMPKKK